MALTAQKVALMVLMLGLMMMGVTVLALADDSLPTGKEVAATQDTYMHNANYSLPKVAVKSRYSGFAQAAAKQGVYKNTVAKQGFVKPDYTPDQVSTEAVNDLPAPFGQELY